MRTQTKCTLILSGMFIVEILPVPFTAIYSLFTVRKRPAWLPGVVERLYADKQAKAGKIVEQPVLDGHDPMVTRRRCTITLSIMFLVDVLVPFTVPFGFYIVRRRPMWFKNVVSRLYADQLRKDTDNQEPVEIDPVYSEVLDKKYLELQQRNFDFAGSIGDKAK